jgi:TolB-like protein/Flp pilus assembly protein TadD
LNKYLDELKRRQVIKVGIAYLVVAWLITQVSSIVLPTFNAPPYILKTLLFVLAIGFPICLILAWVYEITPTGIQKTKTVDPNVPKSSLKGARLKKTIIVGLSIIVILLLYNQFSVKKETPPVPANMEDANEIIVAVLAFEDISQNKDQEYFSDGMSTELTSLLSNMPDIEVRDRRSSFSYKGVNTSIKNIAKELNVTHIIDGSVRKNGEDIRIDVQLIDALEGKSIWSQTFKQKMKDVFQMQDEIALKVREQLKLKLLHTESEPGIVKPEAYSLYLQADFLYFRFDTESIWEAIGLLNESITIDSTFAPAYALLSRALVSNTMNLQKVSFEKGLVEARKAAEKAISLDENNAQAYAALARIDLSQNRDFISAEMNINKALEINSNDAYILANAAIVQGYSGNIENIVEDHIKLLKISPKEYIYYRNLGISQYWTGDLDGALESLKKYDHYFPDAPVGYSITARILMEKGEYEEALLAAQKEPVDFMRYSAQSNALYKLGRVEESKLYYEKFISVNDEKAFANVAEYFAIKGDIENTIKYLEKSYSASDPDLIEIINFPSFKLVYNDPRWEALLVSMELPESHHLFKYIEK